MTQYLHLLSNTSSQTPLDVWTPSGKYIQPQILDQLAIGYFKRYYSYDLEIESFYKTTKNSNSLQLFVHKSFRSIVLT